jgi:spermidine/putrescine transport system ATP-binding protein
VLDAHGARLRAAASRAPATTGDVWVGVRPEKVFLSAEGSEVDESANVLAGGVVTDVSFSGVSTQYLVRMPWGQELMVFEQNTGVRPSFRTGDRVDLRWLPDHTFLLDATQDASAGAITGAAR